MRLRVELDAPLPATLAVGAGTVVFVAGWCVHAEQAVTALELTVDDAASPADAFGAPRLDVFRALHPTLDPYATEGVDRDPASVDDPGMHGYRCGFWGFAEVGPRPAGAVVRFGVRATLADGTAVAAQLATSTVEALPDPAPAGAGADADGSPLVAIAMATYDPPPALLRAQVASIRAQTHRNWRLVISDDGSRPALRALVDELAAQDDRIVVTGTPRRLGFYRNFERALALCPREARHVALADQDDRWDPDKLETLLGALGDAQLVYSDARIVDATGTELAPSYWTVRANEHDDLLALLVANSVTGAASLLRREVLDDALPFPPPQFAHFHDHWLGLVARLRGRVAYVDRPLYDYVQHGDASLGHTAATRMTGLRDRLGGLRADPRERVRMWRLHWFVDVCRLRQVSHVLLLRCGARAGRADRRVLRRFAAGRGWALLAARGAVELTRRRPRTLGAEWMLAYALGWRRLLDATTRARPQRGLRLDAVPPPSFALAPGRTGAAPELRVVEDKVAPLPLQPGEGTPSINLLVPSIDLDHFFGGYIGKFNLARRLAGRGHRVRIVTVDPGPPLPRDWRARIEAFEGLAGVFDDVEVAFGRPGLPVTPQDRWIATTWWTAHIADAAVRETGAPPFHYLVQEHEPFTFPMGTWAALAEQSYRFDHTALYSTELLREWFRRHRLGPFAGADGDARSASFENAITPVVPSGGEPGRRLLFYARPEPHAARNLFELGALALRRAVATGALAGWSLRGIGTTALGRRLELGDGAALELLPRTDQAAYGNLLAGHDVGVSLMHTPHPSLVPIEMAAAGLVTVTSTFEHKDAAALAAISPNLVGAAPTVGAVADAIVDAVARSGDRDARVAAAAATRWARDWDEAFPPALVDRVWGLLG